MSNVVPFRRPARPSAVRPSPGRCDVLAVADDLCATIDALRDLAERAALMRRPSVEIERIVQGLLDATTAVEGALDVIGECSEAAPA